MAEHISPEERLFKVIQEGKVPGKEGGSKRNRLAEWLREAKRFALSIGSASPDRSKGSGRKWAIPAHVKLPELEPEHINKILAAVLVITALLTIYSVVSKRQDTVRLTAAVSKIRISPVSGAGKPTPFKMVDEYIEEIRKRDIFHPTTIAPIVEPQQAVSESLVKSAGNLKLKGISWGDAPKAMILRQDDKENKMYFLTKDQMIGSTGIKIKEIYRNKVVISDGKEDMELL
jgi:hypothetical protein